MVEVDAALRVLNIDTPKDSIREEISSGLQEQFINLNTADAEQDEWEQMFHSAVRRWPDSLPYLNFMIVLFCGYGVGAGRILEQLSPECKAELDIGH